MGWEITLALLIVALIAVAAAALFVLELWLADRVLPGVRVGQVELGGLTRDQAIARLASEFRYPSHLYPVLRYGAQTWPIEPAAMGVQLEVDATVDEALRFGQTDNLIARFREQYDVWTRGRHVAPIFSTDPGAGAVFLSQIASQIELPSRNAALSVGDDQRAEIVPAQTGREVDEELTRQTLVQRIVAMAGGEVDLAVQESEAVLSDLTAAQAEVQRILSSPITLTAPDFEPWIIEPATLADWLVLKPAIDAGGQATLEVSLNLGPAADIAEEIASQVARPPQDAQFGYDVQRNRVVTVVESELGQSLDVTATIPLIESAVYSDQRTVPLPLLPVYPTYASQDAPDVDRFRLIGEGTSSYKGSTAAREKNIIVGTSRFDGLLIAPDKTFSFNRYLGEVTAESGYEESIIIWGNETRTDVGGGLCQVSTTAFRAAFWAGLPITERRAHLFRVSYYEPPKGMDATIFSPWTDLKWENDTGDFLLIRTEVDTAKKTVVFRLFGAGPDRTVEMEGPYERNLVRPDAPIYRHDPTLPKGAVRQIQWARDGLDVTVYRLIKENGEVVRRDKFVSNYQPWQAIYLVGTKE